MLSKEFIGLIVVASLVAIPVGYYLMSNWLETFVYRIDLSPTVFLVAALSVLTIAWITVSTRSIGAARANPVDSLRSE